MSVLPKDFLESATKLATPDCDEITQRNIISRAYYAAYHRSCQLIKPVYSSDENIGMHKQYIQQLNNGKKGSVDRRLGGRLFKMFGRRRIADYLINANIGQDIAPLQLTTAKELFEIIDTHVANANMVPTTPANNSNVVSIR
ncbi:hypothetical protein [Candidatus Nitrotoga arctica]|uniref:HEPN domain-containing protein n=1 Tax=Candidatus Nitrotoga arctica TaxID=453162 RepID=A0ABN8ANI1_9PROT|nr:hypothetical protein [Candidatus Nitrotoga arctica]CAG9932223.1 conserved protein of unknown function [Candidatus Nitrotoga arctica]